MVTAPLSSVVQKKDLHVGGLGAEVAGTLASVTDRIPEVAESWMHWAEDAARDADRFLRRNPWTALAVVAAAGLAAGYLISEQRRPKSRLRLPGWRR